MNPTPQQIQSFSSSYGSTGTSLPSQTPNLSGVTMPRTLSAAPTQNQGENIVTMAENSSINKFGQDIGNSGAAPGNADKYASALQSWGQINQNLKIAVAKNPTNTRLQQALAQSTASEPKLSDFTGQIINKSTESILGDAAGTAVDTIGGAEMAEGVGGLLGVGAKGAAEAVAPTIAQSALKGAGIGGAYGAAGGVSDAMQNNKGVVDTAKEGLESGVVGAGVGAALGGGLTALSKSGGAGIDTAGGEAGAETASKITPEQQAVTDAQNALDKAKTEGQGKVTQAQLDAQNALDEAQKNASVKNAQAETNAKAAAQERQDAAVKGVKGVQDINTKVAGNKVALGNKFQNDAIDLKTSNPNLKSDLTNDQVQTLNGLKESKNFVLPKNLESNGEGLDLSNMNPQVAEQIKGKMAEVGGKTNASVDPVEAQNLIKELNRSTFKQMPDGTYQVDQQRIGITNELKDQFSKDFGKPWDDIYSNYSQGRGAIEKIDNLVNLDPKTTPEDINKQLTGIKNLSKTPEGKILLQQAVEGYKNTSGIDISNPIKAVQDISDKEAGVSAAEDNIKATQKEGQDTIKATQKEGQDTIKATQKEGQDTIKANQKEGEANVKQTQKETATETAARQKDLDAANKAVDKMNKEKLTPQQKIQKVLKMGGRVGSYAARRIIFTEILGLVTAGGGTAVLLHTFGGGATKKVAGFK